MFNKVIHDDCLEVLKTLEENSVDSIITDPPYELGFMGKSWDSTGIANNSLMWAECLRVLKPGGYLLSFGGTRTYHRMASAIEDGGFEVRDMIEWVYGSGFPKSLNIGKAMDKLQGNERESIGIVDSKTGTDKDKNWKCSSPRFYEDTKGTSEWEGWGTALKPAHEPICMARKPLAEKTVAENVLKYGTGGINIEESRVEGIPRTTHSNGNHTGSQENKVAYSKLGEDFTNDAPSGRFPANLIHDNSEEVRECFPDTHARGNKTQKSFAGGEYNVDFGQGNGYKECGLPYDSGNASRFFKSIIYKAKASKAERNKGCDELEEKQYSHDGREKEIENPYQRNKSLSTNNHPTVKPIAIMEYLIKMVTKQGGVVLDPFAGSGTTGVACINTNRNFILIEKEQEYIEIINKRIEQHGTTS